MKLDFINFPLDVIGYAISSISDNVFLHKETHNELSHKSNAEILTGLADKELLDDYDDAFLELLNYESSYAILKGVRDYYLKNYDENIVIDENDVYKELIYVFNNNISKLKNESTADLTEFFNDCEKYRTYNITEIYKTTIKSIQESENLIRIK